MVCFDRMFRPANVPPDVPGWALQPAERVVSDDGDIKLSQDGGLTSGGDGIEGFSVYFEEEGAQRVLAIIKFAKSISFELFSPLTSELLSFDVAPSLIINDGFSPLKHLKGNKEGIIDWLASAGFDGAQQKAIYDAAKYVMRAPTIAVARRVLAN